jgi:hypothetical protein
VNADTVAQWLGVVGVPAEVVSIGAEADNAWCLLPCEPEGLGDGQDGAADRAADPAAGPAAGPAADRAPEWEVFWREQGNRYDWARFSNEQVACFYLFGRLAWTQTASGALRLAHPVMPQDGAR